MESIVDVPEVFRPSPCFEYPRYNTVTFEEYFYRYFLELQPATKRKYLPILWSVFYYTRHYRVDGTQDLQEYLNNLDPSQPYFTICAYDGGTFENTSHLDLKVFSSIGDTVSMDWKTYKGNVGNRAIPLTLTPAPGINLNRERDVLAGFVGASTSPEREAIWKMLSDKPEFEVRESIVSPVCSFKKMDQDKWATVGYEGFKDLMERSVFALCPRGSSPTTFRICESLQYGCVPVYISDHFWFPWSNPKDPNDHGMFDQIGITCTTEEIPDLPRRLKSMSKSRIDEYLQAGRELYQDYFSSEGCASHIIEEVNHNG